MEYTKYVCHRCLHQSKEPALCPNCHTPLIANCAVCGNPVVGEQVQLED